MAQSLVDQFNASVDNFEAQTNDEWVKKSMSSLCRKFTLLAKSSETDAELKDLVTAMTDFLTDYIRRPYSDGYDYETIDAVTDYIDQMGSALVGATKLGMIPAGTAKELNRLAAEIVGMGEDNDDGDCDDAFQAQADKIGEIADAIQRFEALPPKPASAPAASAPGSPPGATNDNPPLKLSLKR